MPTIQVGRTEIAYELRRSAGAGERRITVTPGHVEVLALSTDEDQDIEGFLARKRQWLFNTMREMERVTVGRHAVPRFITGSRIPYRGRHMPLTVRRSDAEHMGIAYRNGFVVDLPHWVGRDVDRLVASELRLWLKQRVRRDVISTAADYGRKFGLVPKSVRVADFASGWGSCGPEGNILINWHMIFAPRKVLEYVVAHELAHLSHRSHGPDFWKLMSTVYPRWADAQAWLDRHHIMLSSDFFRDV